MKITCKVGVSDLSGFKEWWEASMPAWLIIYCREGEAQLSLQFKPYSMVEGTLIIIAPDMFPSIVSSSEDFSVNYCLMNREFADKSFYNVPNAFFDFIYQRPMLPVGNTMDLWMNVLQAVGADFDNSYRLEQLANTVHSLVLCYCNRWEQMFGGQIVQNEKNSAEEIYTRFYDLVFDNYKEHRNTAYYADRLCITPCYLAMVTRQICNETPKQVIDRFVTLEMKYMLSNSSMTAQQMADVLHFPDTSYLCRFFRRHTGLSLSEYRRQEYGRSKVPETNAGRTD